MGIKEAVDRHNQVMDILNNAKPCMCSHYRRHLEGILDLSIEAMTDGYEEFSLPSLISGVRKILKNPLMSTMERKSPL